MPKMATRPITLTAGARKPERPDRRLWRHSACRTSLHRLRPPLRVAPTPGPALHPSSLPPVNCDRVMDPEPHCVICRLNPGPFFLIGPRFGSRPALPRVDCDHRRAGSSTTRPSRLERPRPPQRCPATTRRRRSARPFTVAPHSSTAARSSPRPHVFPYARVFKPPLLTPDA
jgi:hypothetical protein